MKTGKGITWTAPFPSIWVWVTVKALTLRDDLLIDWLVSFGFVYLSLSLLLFLLIDNEHPSIVLVISSAKRSFRKVTNTWQ
jgi:hypothetical protein